MEIKMLNKTADKRVQDIRKGQKELIRNILLAGLATGTTLYGGTRLMDILANTDEPKKVKKNPVFMPFGTSKRKKEVGDMDKFSSTKTAGISDYFNGKENVDLFEASPYTIPLSILAAGGGIYGGYKGSELLYNLLKGNEQENRLEDVKNENKKLLQARYRLSKMQSVQKDIDSAFDRYIESNNMEKKAVIGMLGGTALTLGGLLWAIAHKKVRDHMIENDKERKRYEKIKNKLKYTDLNQAATGKYLSLDNGDKVGDDNIKLALYNNLKNKGYDAINNLTPDKFNELNAKAKTEAEAAANNPATSQAMVQPFINNKDKVVEAVNEVAADKIKKNAPGFLTQ